MKPKKRPHGTIRRSQVLTTYGPGAMVDLPTRSVIVAGLESWSEGGREPVFEDRLVQRLQKRLGVPGLKLATPPGDTGDPLQPYTGITAWIFPEWFVGPYEAPEDGKRPADGTRSRPLVHREKLIDGKYQKKEVVPIRFVQACVNGHIDDIPWYLFVHGPDDGCRRQLWVDERGTTGDLTNVTIRCDCGKSRSMATAEFRSKKDAHGEDTGGDRAKAPLGYCRGRRPWLGPRSQESCVNDHGEPEVNRLLVRSASNAWFSETVSVISIPDADAALMKAVEAIWPMVSGCSTLDEFRMVRKLVAPVRTALEGWADERVWEAVERKRQPGTQTDKGLKEAELEMLLDSRDELGTDLPEGDFYARRLKLPDDFAYAEQIDRVVLVHRLREVMVLLGFTRFEAPVPDEDGELGLGVRRAAIAKDLTWLPAIENRGEGIFIAFRKEAIDAWMARPEVEARWQALKAGHDRWRTKHPKFRGALPGLPYILLHSLSHMLMTSVALECGYAATSIRERIYALPDTGYGILLYTGTTDAEGTLGGLVQVGRSIDVHLAAALERGRLCSHDPVCAYHQPANPHEERFLHGAACHACVLVSETSCEQRNELLDRALVVPTVESAAAAFFGDP
jgi:hypothetical protein